MKLYKVNYILLAIGFLGVLLPFANEKANRGVSLNPLQESHELRKEKATQRQAELRSNYPTVDYEERESSDPRLREVQRARKQRHNHRPIVAKEPSPKDVEVASFYEGQFDFPALPFEKSDLVALVSVLRAEAHMSEDKSSVYSEFDVRVLEIFKPLESKLSAGQDLTIERDGGIVKYPNGQQIRYRITNAGMPKAGGRYVMFLNRIPDSDVYRILTGYELDLKGVHPLDFSPQFETYKNFEENAFLKALRNSL
jgi:hypothetical protein